MAPLNPTSVFQQFQNTIEVPVWAQKIGESTLFTTPLLYIPQGTFAIVWNLNTLGDFGNAVAFEPEIGISLPPQGVLEDNDLEVQNSALLTPSQWGAVITNSRTSGTATLNYSINANWTGEPTDPTVVVTPDPVFIPPQLFKSPAATQVVADEISIPAILQCTIFVLPGETPQLLAQPLWVPNGHWQVIFILIDPSSLTVPPAFSSSSLEPAASLPLGVTFGSPTLVVTNQVLMEVHNDSTLSAPIAVTVNLSSPEVSGQVTLVVTGAATEA